MNEQIIVKLSDIEHTLLRPAIYIGSVNFVEADEFVLNGGGSFEKKTVRYVPALLKIVNEIIDNSVDEAVRTSFKHGDKIKITLTDKSICVEDNGRGIPVKKVAGTDIYMPVMAFTEAKAGSNFSDDEAA
jgi:DNA gyrase/topoisomerase IV subunit B